MSESSDIILFVRSSVLKAILVTRHDVTRLSIRVWAAEFLFEVCPEEERDKYATKLIRCCEKLIAYFEKKKRVRLDPLSWECANAQASIEAANEKIDKLWRILKLAKQKKSSLDVFEILIPDGFDEKCTAVLKVPNPERIKTEVHAHRALVALTCL